ncbi:NTP transferase domain-containing protein [uncultured Gilvimarinus sp.]|uniref:nucleotidyltransferase family protein n=1 Tax=uncultured Gilvimarinus sp. TaxID=1689143 RepID=UPI0030D6DE55
MSFDQWVTHSDHLVALIVAAGFSNRFGSADKRSAKLDKHQTLLAASYASAARFFTNCRVLIRDDDDIRALGLAPETPVCRTQHARQGQGASMADGFKALLTDDALANVQSAAVWLGDIPHITPSTLTQLSCKANPDNIIRPIWADQIGHPVFFGRRFWPELAELHGDKGAAKILKHYHATYQTIAVEDSGVCRDIDTQDDFKSLQLQLASTRGTRYANLHRDD